MTISTADDDEELGALAAPALGVVSPPVSGSTVWARACATWHIAVPLLLLAILAAPGVTFLLPATEDYIDEIYQPLQALKFFKTHGTAFHKYGPMANFVLAPGYGASLLYWKETGNFSKPSEVYPFGFSRPFEQMGFMILQGRLLFLMLGVVGIASLAHACRRISKDRAVVFWALLFTIATNYAIAYAIPSPRPDSGMLAFSAMALACYVTILFDGLTIHRGVWMSIFAVCAISSKELAAPMFVFPYLGLVAMVWREGDDQPGGADRATNALVWSVVAGVIAYALLNIVYAPHTWVERMRFWIGGPGIDADVWGSSTPYTRAIRTLGRIFDCFGPGGSIVTLIAVACLLLARPRRSVLLMLPALSVLLLGLVRIKYPQDRFYTIFCLPLFPAVVAGLDVARRVPLQRYASSIATAIFVLLAFVNLWWSTFTWHALHGTFEYGVEQHAIANVPRNQRVTIFNTYPWNPCSTRLCYLGFNFENRSIQQMAATRSNLPRWIYTSRGRSMFIDQAKSMPARAALIKQESGFDVNDWSGLEGLGYELEATIVPQTPAWFPFDFMPAVHEWKQRRAVMVYRLKEAS